MRTSRPTWRRALPLPLAAALLASCSIGNPTLQTDNSAQRPQTAVQKQAADLGLQTPSSGGIGPNDFQIRDAGGNAVKGAVVTVGTQRLVTDDQGKITMPADLYNGKDPVIMSVEAPGYVTQQVPVVPGFALNLVPEDKNATHITAAAGGVARNADDTMEVSFTPGSLDKDATVHVTRTYSPDAPTQIVPPEMAANVVNPEDYSYSMDLGGAQITPSAGITVRFKVSPLAQDYLDNLKANNGLDKVNEGDSFYTAPDGSSWFTMTVPGAPQPQTASASTSGKYTLQSYACNNYTDPYTYWAEQVVWSGVNGGVDHNNGCVAINGGVRFHDWRINGGSCVYWYGNYQCVGGTNQSGSHGVGANIVHWVQETGYYHSSTVNAHVAWSSDDSRVTGNVNGALVFFHHAGTPTRSATPYAWTDGSGYANGVGASNTWGWANAWLPSQSYTYGTSAGYYVNCSTANLAIVKNKPRVQFSVAPHGDATGGTYQLPTTLGNQAIASLSNPVIAPAFNNVADATESFDVAGSWQPDANTWIDASSPSATLEWNNANNGWQANHLGLDIWFSKQIGADLTYSSNDNSVPADEQPATKWAGQVASANVVFAHAVSTYGGKKHADTLTFQSASHPTTWGLNGAAGTVAATVSNAGVTLAGNATYTVNGGRVGVVIPANLPSVTIPVSGELGTATGFTLTYTLDGVKKTMAVTRSGSGISFSLPVEDALNQPGKHNFTIISVGNTDVNLLTPNGQAFPTMSVWRGLVANYPIALQGIVTTAK